MNKLQLSALTVVVALGITGCAAQTPTANTVIPSLVATATPTPQPEAATLLLAADHLEVLSQSDDVMASVSFTEPIATTLDVLTALFGDPVATDEPGDQCGFGSRTYSWGDTLSVIDVTGFTADPPRDTLPYRILATTAELDGVKITTPAGIGVGDQGGDYLFYENSGVSAGEFLLDQAGSVTLGSEEQPIGVFAYAEDRDGPLQELSTPATLFDVWHEC